jgi:hypothetical protein
MREEITAWGHQNITALHKTTLEITKDRELTKRGDCIIGVNADKAISEISDAVKKELKKGRKAKVILSIPDYGLSERLEGYGSSGMTFDHGSDIVIRKSDFVCSRTLLVRSDKAACDIEREMVELLKDPQTELVFIIEV